MTAAFRALLSAPMSGSRPSLKHVSASRNACGRVSSTSFPARVAYFSTRYPSSINPAIMSLVSLLLAYGQYWFTVIFCWRASPCDLFEDTLHGRPLRRGTETDRSGQSRWLNVARAPRGNTNGAWL